LRQSALARKKRGKGKGCVVRRLTEKEKEQMKEGIDGHGIKRLDRSHGRKGNRKGGDDPLFQEPERKKKKGGKVNR